MVSLVRLVPCDSSRHFMLKYFLVLTSACSLTITLTFISSPSCVSFFMDFTCYCSPLCLFSATAVFGFCLLDYLLGNIVLALWIAVNELCLTLLNGLLFVNTAIVFFLFSEYCFVDSGNLHMVSIFSKTLDCLILSAVLALDCVFFLLHVLKLFPLVLPSVQHLGFFPLPLT